MTDVQASVSSLMLMYVESEDVVMFLSSPKTTLTFVSHPDSR